MHLYYDQTGLSSLHMVSCTWQEGVGFSQTAGGLKVSDHISAFPSVGSQATLGGREPWRMGKSWGSPLLSLGF